MKLGFIGQGWIGKNFANSYEAKGFSAARYALEAPYNTEENKKAIAESDVVFIAVPSPTTPSGFSDAIIRSALTLIGKGKCAVIKSTMAPGTTDALAADFPDIFVYHSPEFLREASAAWDVENPVRNIIGVPSKHFANKEWYARAESILALLPDTATCKLICKATEAELIKQVANAHLYVKTVFMNSMYDLAQNLGADWLTVAEALKADPRIGNSHMQPVHQYGHMSNMPGRGAGGHCFIKDFATLRASYELMCKNDVKGIAMLRAIEEKNKELLMSSGKDIDLYTGVYGKID